MDRFVLTDAQWAKMEPLCLGKPGDPGRRGKDNRLFVEAVLWIARTGSPWRDLPPLFGHWNSVFTRFRDWVKADSQVRLRNDRDLESLGPWFRFRHQILGRKPRVRIQHCQAPDWYR